MLAIELITEDVPPIRPNDSGQKALNWMDELKVAHLPVVKGHNLIGVISEADILDLNSPNDAVEKSTGDFLKVFIRENQHVYDIMRIISETGLTVIPVIDGQDNYMGCITLAHLMRKLTEIASISEAGSVIVLEMNQNDYSLSQISQIVEGNDAQILSSYVTSKSDSTLIQVTIKVNRQEIGGILQTFNRYDYTIAASYQENNYTDDLKDRYDGLMKFLNI